MTPEALAMTQSCLHRRMGEGNKNKAEREEGEDVFVKRVKPEVRKSGRNQCS
jgi:hypothetical protein